LFLTQIESTKSTPRTTSHHTKSLLNQLKFNLNSSIFAKDELSGISLLFGTHNRTNSCSLHIEISNGQRSNSVPCRSIKDNSFARFDLDPPIEAAKYNFSIVTTSDVLENNFVDIYFEGSVNVNTFTAPAKLHFIKNNFQLISNWFQAKKSNAIYFMIFAFLLMVCIALRESNIKLCIIVCTFYALLVVIMPRYSGYDETAHIWMYKSAEINRTPRSSDNVEINLDMKNQHFYSFHNVREIPDSVCPHRILGGCGKTALPMRYYNALASITPTDNPDPIMSHFNFVIINATFICSMLVLIYFLFPISQFQSTLIVFALMGGIYSQFPTITNDLPMFLFGVLLLNINTYFLSTSKNVLRHILAFFLAVLSLLIGRNIDHSYLAIIPSLFLIVTVGISKFALKKSPPMNRQNPMAPCAIFFAAGLSIILFLYNGTVRDMIISGLTKFTNKAVFLENFVSSSLETKLEIFLSYFKSIVGTFVWGHSYFETFQYIISFIFLSYMAIRGLIKSQSYLDTRIGALWFSLAFWGSIILIISSVPYDIDILDSYSKVRKTAPSIAIILLLPFMGLNFTYHKLQARHILSSGVIIWLAVVVFFSLPKFFLAPIYLPP